MMVGRLYNLIRKSEYRMHPKYNHISSWNRIYMDFAGTHLSEFDGEMVPAMYMRDMLRFEMARCGLPEITRFKKADGSGIE